MGDEKEENTRLLLSIPEKHLPELLHRLLPEFDAYFTESDTAPIRPPKAIWWKKIIDSAKLLVFLAIGWTLMITVFGVTGLPAVLGLSLIHISKIRAAMHMPAVIPVASYAQLLYAKQYKTRRTTSLLLMNLVPPITIAASL